MIVCIRWRLSLLKRAKSIFSLLSYLQITGTSQDTITPIFIWIEELNRTHVLEMKQMYCVIINHQ